MRGDAGVIVFGFSTELVTLTAEALAALLLAPIAFDLVERGILDPRARVVPWHRVVWYTLLVAAPLTFVALDNGAGIDGLPGEVLEYAGRTTEVFLCLLALQLYFVLGLGRTGLPTAHDEGAPASAGILPR